MTALLSDPAEIAHRRSLRGASHLAGFAPLLASLRARHGEVPDPDPLDGGAAARLLLLLETPGPKIRASGIVSRDNPTGTGRNLRAMLAGIARRDTLIWNAVPWIIHPHGALNRAPNRAELQGGIAELPALIALLPNLQVAVLAGRSAGFAADTLAALRPGLPVFRMAHPSPTIQCTSPAIRAGCRAALAEAAAVLASAHERIGDAA